MRTYQTRQHLCSFAPAATTPLSVHSLSPFLRSPRVCPLICRSLQSGSPVSCICPSVVHATGNSIESPSVLRRIRTPLAKSYFDLHGMRIGDAEHSTPDSATNVGDNTARQYHRTCGPSGLAGAISVSACVARPAYTAARLQGVRPSLFSRWALPLLPHDEDTDEPY